MNSSKLVCRYRHCLTRRTGDKIRPEDDRHELKSCCELVIPVYQQPDRVLRIPADCAMKIGEAKRIVANILGHKTTSDLNIIMYDTAENEILACSDEVHIEDIQQQACDDLEVYTDDRDAHRNTLILPCLFVDSEEEPMDVIYKSRQHQKKIKPISTVTQDPKLISELDSVKKKLKAARQRIAELEQKNKSLKTALDEANEHADLITCDRERLRVQLEALKEVNDEF